MTKPLTIDCWLNRLDDHLATYFGPTNVSVYLDRATFMEQGRPVSISITVPMIEHPMVDHVDD